MRFLLGVMVGVLAQFLWTPIPAHADPMCNFRHDCGWGEPFNGQQQPEQNTQGTYGGWTTNPVYCDPQTGVCRVLVPGR